MTPAMIDWYTAADLADLRLPGLPTSKRGVQMQADRERWGERLDAEGAALCRRRKGRGGGVEYHLSVLPELAQAKLLSGHAANGPATAPVEARESVWRRYESLPAGLKSEAKRRLCVIQRVEALHHGGLAKSLAVSEVATGLRRAARFGEGEAVSESAIYAWLRLIAGVDLADRVAYLAPAYFGRTKEAECDPAAWAFFRDLWLQPSRPTVAACYRRLELVAAQEGWAYPSQKTLQRWTVGKINRALRILMREGAEALKREEPWIERDETTFHALEAVNVDGHKWDVLVDFGDGRPVRPMMVAIQDVYSRKMLGWRIARSENSNAVRMAFAQVFEDYGIPRRVFFDNGRAFASKWLTGGTATRYRFTVREEDPVGLLNEFGCQIHFTTPYAGQSKPIERSFRDLEGEIGTHPAFQGAYVGNNPLNKPHDAGARAIPIAEFERIVEDGLTRHNQRPKRSTRACAGRLSFSEAFKASYTEALIAVATPEQLRKALMCVEGVKVRQNGHGLTLGDNRYWGDFLVEHVGEKVAARFDPDDLHAGLHVYSLAGVYLGFAECLAPIGFANAEEGREAKRLARRISKAAKELRELEAIRAARELADMLPPALPEEPPQRGAVVAPIFGALALKPTAQTDELAFSEAEIVELHARAVGSLRAAPE